MFAWQQDVQFSAIIVMLAIADQEFFAGEVVRLRSVVFEAIGGSQRTQAGAGLPIQPEAISGEEAAAKRVTAARGIYDLVGGYGLNSRLRRVVIDSCALRAKGHNHEIKQRHKIIP